VYAARVCVCKTLKYKEEGNEAEAEEGRTSAPAEQLQSKSLFIKLFVTYYDIVRKILCSVV